MESDICTVLFLLAWGLGGFVSGIKVGMWERRKKKYGDNINRGGKRA